MNRKKILIVDDDPDIIVSMKAVLESAGHEVETAYSGQECIDKFPVFLPDIIFLVDLTRKK